MKILKGFLLVLFFLILQVSITVAIVLLLQNSIIAHVASTSTYNYDHGPDIGSLFEAILGIGAVAVVLAPLIYIPIFVACIYLAEKFKLLRKVKLVYKVLIVVLVCFLTSFSYQVSSTLLSTASTRITNEKFKIQVDYESKGYQSFCPKEGDCFYIDQYGKKVADSPWSLTDTTYITDVRPIDFLAVINFITLLNLILSAVYVFINLIFLLITEGIIKLTKKLS